MEIFQDLGIYLLYPKAGRVLMYVRLWMVYHLARKIDGNVNMFQYTGQIASTCT